MFIIIVIFINKYTIKYSNNQSGERSVKNYKNFKKWSIFVVFVLVSTAVFMPANQGLSINKENSNSNIKSTAVFSARDFSISLHRIQEEDEIDPGSGADWTIRMYVNGERKSYNHNGNNDAIDKTFVWKDIITDTTTNLDIKIELKERDIMLDDIADISAHAGGGADDSEDFDSHRGAVFLRTYNVEKRAWAPQDENNDYVMIDDDNNVKWYKTSGNFDGSTKKDENDATVWFNVFVENRAPYAPEKPQGPTEGDVFRTYTFKTRCGDPDGDRIQYGWDWDGDGEVDEVTGFYDTWATCTIEHMWKEAGIYHVQVIAIDEYGMPGKRSEELIVGIASPSGKSGFKAEKRWYGYEYTWYLDHQETSDLIKTLRQGSNVVTAIAALVAAVAALYGVPLDVAASRAIAVAIVRLGVEAISMMDMHNKGIYFRILVFYIGDFPIASVAYVWAQE